MGTRHSIDSFPARNIEHPSTRPASSLGWDVLALAIWLGIVVGCIAFWVVFLWLIVALVQS